MTVAGHDGVDPVAQQGPQPHRRHPVAQQRPQLAPGGGAIHASGSRSARSNWARIAAPALSFFSWAEAIALHRSECTRCGANP